MDALFGEKFAREREREGEGTKLGRMLQSKIKQNKKLKTKKCELISRSALFISLLITFQENEGIQSKREERGGGESRINAFAFFCFYIIDFQEDFD